MNHELLIQITIVEEHIIELKSLVEDEITKVMLEKNYTSFDYNGQTHVFEDANGEMYPLDIELIEIIDGYANLFNLEEFTIEL